MIHVLQQSLLNEENVKSLEACLAKGIVVFDAKNSWHLPAWFFTARDTLFGETGSDDAAGIELGGEAESMLPTLC